MATKKDSNLIQYEIEFIETKLAELKQYIEDRPFHELKDRYRMQQTKAGGVMEVLTASIEVQRKDITSAIKEYAELTIVVEKMRQADEAKQKEVRGGGDVPYRMRQRDGDNDK